MSFRFLLSVCNFLNLIQVYFRNNSSLFKINKKHQVKIYFFLLAKFFTELLITSQTYFLKAIKF